MPYTTAVPGTTITAAWANANVRDQVITPFASASARNSAITSPVDGMHAYLADAPKRLTYYNGSKWITVVARVKATQTSFPNTTFAPVTGMSIPLEANSVYEFDLLVYAGSFQNVGLMLALQLPSLATLDTQTLGWRDDTGAFQATSTVGATGNAPLHAGNGWGYNGSGNFSTVTSKGTVTTAGTAGSAVLLGCQRVSSGNQSQVGASSWMELRQVA